MADGSQIESIGELIRVSEFKPTLNALARALGIHIALLDRKFNCLASSEPLPYCCEESEQACIHAELEPLASSTEGTCELGMKVICAPIIVRSERIGSMTACAFHDEVTKRQAINRAEELARKLQIQPSEAIPQSVREFQTKIPQEIDNIEICLRTLGGYIGKLGYDIHDMALGLIDLQEGLIEMFNTAAEVASFLEPGPLLEQFLEDAMDSANAQSGFLLLWDAGDNEMKLEEFRNVTRSEVEAIVSKLHLRELSPDNTAYSGRILNDIPTEENYLVTSENPQIQRILTAPLKTSDPSKESDHLIGVVALLNREQSAPIFTSSDKQKLLHRSTLVATAVEKIRDEMLVVADTQKHLLSRELPNFDYLDIGVAFAPKGLVTGDFYKFYKFDDSILGFALGDATGKGVSAALQMATVIASLGILEESELRISSVFPRLNSFVFNHNPPDRQATLFYGILSIYSDYKTSKMNLNYVNAGHPAPALISRDGNTTKLLFSTGNQIGISPTLNPKYGENFTELSDGDILVLYTDGVVDAQNPQDEAFGLNRLMGTIRDNIRHNKELSAQELADGIHLQVREFSQGCPQFDDITIVVLKLRENLA
jgi:serine phosphatase RsbU (regulator of sigma subunit)